MIAFLDFLTATIGPCVFVSHSSYVRRSWARILRGTSLLMTNADLWRSIRAAMQDRNVRVAKVESHLSYIESCELHIDFRHWAGKAIADAIAELVANAFQLAQGHVDAVSSIDRISQAVVRSPGRGHPSAMPRARPPPPPLCPQTSPPRPPLHTHSIVSSTSHTFAFQSGRSSRMVCSTCGDRPAVTALRSWLRAPCRGSAVPHEVALSSLPSLPTVGGAAPQPCHALRLCDVGPGIRACTVCGQFPAAAPRALAQPCARRLNTRGQWGRSRIQQGLWPSSTALRGPGTLSALQASLPASFSIAPLPLPANSVAPAPSPHYTPRHCCLLRPHRSSRCPSRTACPRFWVISTPRQWVPCNPRLTHPPHGTPGTLVAHISQTRVFVW